MPIRIKAPEWRTYMKKHGTPTRKELQEAYMKKHGQPEARRKRLTPRAATARDRAKKIEKLHERMGGGEKGKPHSSREGRIASGKRTLKRFRKKAEDALKPKWKRQPEHLPAKKAKGKRIGYYGGGRTNLLEELGRVEAEPSNRNRRAEISRVHGELNKGYKGGKRVGLKNGSSAQSHYLQHGYGPHKLKMVKASDKAIKGNKLTKKA
jgi:hypothetical protein